MWTPALKTVRAEVIFIYSLMVNWIGCSRQRERIMLYDYSRCDTGYEKVCRRSCRISKMRMAKIVIAGFRNKSGGLFFIGRCSCEN